MNILIVIFFLEEILYQNFRKIKFFMVPRFVIKSNCYKNWILLSKMNAKFWYLNPSKFQTKRYVFYSQLIMIRKTMPVTKKNIDTIRNAPSPFCAVIRNSDWRLYIHWAQITAVTTFFHVFFLQKELIGRIINCFSCFWGILKIQKKNFFNARLKHFIIHHILFSNVIRVDLNEVENVNLLK